MSTMAYRNLFDDGDDDDDDSESEHENEVDRQSLSDDWVVLWSTTAPHIPKPLRMSSRIHSPPLNNNNVFSNIIRIDVDHTRWLDWYEIDAIKLKGFITVAAAPPPPPGTLAFDLGTLLDQEYCTDIEIIVSDSRKVKAHAGVLVARCEAFKAMFTNGMKESSAKVISIPDIAYDVMKLLLRYLYTDTVEVPFEHSVALYVAADKYGLIKLMKLCVDEFADSLEEENVIPLYIQVAEQETFRKVCCEYITKNYQTLVNTSPFATLPHNLLLEVMRSVAKVATTTTTTTSKYTH